MGLRANFKNYEVHTDVRFGSLRTDLAAVPNVRHEQDLGNGLRVVGDRSISPYLFVELTGLPPLTPEEEEASEETFIPMEDFTFQYQTSFTVFGTSLDALANLNGGMYTGLSHKLEGETSYSTTLPKNFPVRSSGRISPFNLEVKVVLSAPSDKYFGTRFNFTETDAFLTFTGAGATTPPPVISAGWQGTHPWRASTRANILLKHPLMPANLGDIRVFNGLNIEVSNTVKRYGDYLIIDNSTPPFTVYFNETSSLPAPSVTKEYAQALLAQRTEAPYWGGIERYKAHRNLVNPSFQVLLGSTLENDKRDVTPFVSQINDGQVTLYGPASELEFDEESDFFPRYLQIKSEGNYIYTGRVIRASSVPYANGRMVTLMPLSFSEFNNVDLADIDAKDVALPANEDHYIKALLERSKYEGSLFVGGSATEINFRRVNFWEDTPPHGPGFVPEEVLYKYWNSQGGSSLQEIKNVLHANMLELYDLPDGNLLLAPILPYASLTLKQIFDTYALKYNVQSTSYVVDPRLTIQEVSLDIDDTFGEIEIEGSSNEVSFGLKKSYAMFKQGDDGKISPYFIKSLRAYVRDSNTGGWPDSDAPGPGDPGYPYPNPSMNDSPSIPEGDSTPQVNNLPWMFVGEDGGAKYYPESWYKESKIAFNETTITAEKIGGGNRWTNSLRLRKKPLGQLGAYMINPLNPDQQIRWGERFVQLFGNDPTLPVTTSTQAAWAFSAGATGTVWSNATFQFKVLVPELDESSLKLEPLVGKYQSDFVPNWLDSAIIESKMNALNESKPRKAKRIQNGFIGQIGQSNAVQKFNRQNDFTLYDKEASYAASQLASWLTVKEYLMSRRVTLAFAGSSHWYPGQFIAIARRPSNGPGSEVNAYDMLMVASVSKADAMVGGEAWVKVSCGFIGTLYRDANGFWQTDYEFPLAWGSFWS